MRRQPCAVRGDPRIRLSTANALDALSIAAATRPDAIVMGVYMTGSGFNDNFENIYFIKVPKVLGAFDTQFARVWDGEKATPDEQDPPLATPRNLMPATDLAGQ